MRSNYKKLGQYIREVDERDVSKNVTTLLGVSIQKKFMPSIANTIGTDMSTYKVVRRNQFAYGPVTSRNGDKISIALLEDHDEVIVSQAYMPFEVIDKNELLPEYLMLWFRRPEFDRYARFMSHGSAREIFGWEEMCNTELPIPHIDKQREIVKEYNTIVNRINLNNQLIQKLEETAQSIYKQWFVDFEFPFDFAQGVPDEEGKPYRSNGGEMEWNEGLEMEVPKGWEMKSFTQVVQVGGGGTPNTEVLEYWNGEILFYTPGDLTGRYYSITAQKKITTLGLQKCSSKLYPANTTFVTARGATVGGIAIAGVPMAMNQTCYALSCKMSEGYFTHQLSLNIISKLKKQAVGATFEALVTKDFEGQSILEPSNDLIISYDLVAKPIYINLLNREKENNCLSNMKSLLLSKLATIEN